MPTQYNWSSKLIHIILGLLYCFSFLTSNIGQSIRFDKLFRFWIMYVILPVDLKMWIIGMWRHPVLKWLTLGQITFTHCILPWVLLVKTQRQNSCTIAGTWVLFLMPLTSSQQLPAESPSKNCATIWCLCCLVIFRYICCYVIFKIRLDANWKLLWPWKLCSFPLIKGLNLYCLFIERCVIIFFTSIF
jgi:hypothetical protein